MSPNHSPRNLLVTGGSGFIGGHFIRAVFANPALRGTSGWANNFLGRDHHQVAPPEPAVAPDPKAPPPLRPI